MLGAPCSCVSAEPNLVTQDLRGTFPHFLPGKALVGSALGFPPGIAHRNQRLGKTCEQWSLGLAPAPYSPCTPARNQPRGWGG